VYAATTAESRVRSVLGIGCGAAQLLVARRMHNDGMRLEDRGSASSALASLARAAIDRVKRWRGRPPEDAGVREPRRPRPTLPVAAVALAEPRVGRWFKLTGRSGTDRP
jgi:hypothetical protein